MPKATTLDPKKFNYLLFKDDLNKFRKKEGYTLEYISQMKLFRCKAYLSTVLSQKALPVSMLTPICEFMQVNASKYKIEEPEPVPAVESTLKLNTHDDVERYYIEHPEAKPVLPAESGWECRIRVDYDFETVMMKVLKNGEEMALARCYFFSNDDIGIMQAISYAAHQCYKMYQQTDLARQESDDDLRKEVRTITTKCASAPNPGDVSSFKNWILKYKTETGKIGALARYCEQLYAVMPSHGERKIRMFFQMEKEGRQHIEVFNAIWPLFLKEARKSNLD